MNKMIKDRLAIICSFLYKLRYAFYYKIENKVGYLQADLNLIRSIPKISLYNVVKLDLEKPNSINKWIDLVENAYGDESYDIEKARMLHSRHLFLEETETFLLMDGALPVATVSIGIYRDSPHVGGVYRIAVRKSHQGKSLGLFIILYGYLKLKERGIKYAESIVTIKREKSIMLHYYCGFRPQHNMEYISYRGALRNINLIQRLRIRMRLNRMYRSFWNKAIEDLLRTTKI